jgi:uncharacterized protein (DUF169 family)
MNYTDAVKHLIWNLRLDFDPVGIRYVKDTSEIKHLSVTHKSKAKLTFCQYLAACRQACYALYMAPSACLCENAPAVFGFRELHQETDTIHHMKYFSDADLAWKASKQKAKLPIGECKGIYIAPLAAFDKTDLAPSIIFIMCLSYQAYHILNDYMNAAGKPNLTFFHTPNSAVCSGSVWAYNNHTANLTTMCAGSKTSGKSEMAYMNLFIPGDQFIATIEQQVKRCNETGGPSLLGKGGQHWPGLDACKSCPMFRFEEV